LRLSALVIFKMNRQTLHRAMESLDLLAEKEGLLQKIKNRDALLQELERKNPGITEVERDVDGYILSLD